MELESEWPHRSGQRSCRHHTRPESQRLIRRATVARLPKSGRRVHATLEADAPSPTGPFSANLAGRLTVLAAPGTILVLMIGVAFARIRLLAPETKVQQTYAQMVRYARHAGYNAATAETPHQISQQLNSLLFPDQISRRIAGRARRKLPQRHARVPRIAHTG